MSDTSSVLAAVTTTKFLALSVTLCVIYVIYAKFVSRSRSRSTRLFGPPRASWLWGNNLLMTAENGAKLHEQWSATYGGVFAYPGEMAATRLIVMDPKAINHVLASYSYPRPEGKRKSVSLLLGGGILVAEGDDHRRQRKALNPGFTPQAVRQFCPVFFDNGHKIVDAWNAVFAEQKQDVVAINVRPWMDRVTLDSIGLCGFAHEFGTLHGRPSPVADVLHSFGTMKPSFLSRLTLLLMITFPMVFNLPSEANRNYVRLNDAFGALTEELLKQEEESGGTDDGFYMLRPMMRTGKLSREELSCQMKTLLLAGFETTAVALTWCLHELSLRPDLQSALRKELAEHAFPPTFEQLWSGLPLLDAVTREVLRIHPPVAEHACEAGSDDIIPLSEPLLLPSGETVSEIKVAAGTGVTVCMEAINRSELLWGPTAHEFDPYRWMEGEKGLEGQWARELQGYHHMMTFIDGPRNCVGKNFALTEFKAVLSVLIREFVFEPEGRKVGMHRGLLPVLMPHTEGTEGNCLLLKVRRVET